MLLVGRGALEYVEVNLGGSLDCSPNKRSDVCPKTYIRYRKGSENLNVMLKNWKLNHCLIFVFWNFISSFSTCRIYCTFLQIKKYFVDELLLLIIAGKIWIAVSRSQAYVAKIDVLLYTQLMPRSILKVTKCAIRPRLQIDGRYRLPFMGPRLYA